MPIVKASENPIPINEEVLDEGLIDAIRQGANYLKDRHTVRKYNRLANTINQSSNPSQFTNSENYKKKYNDAMLANNRTENFKGYIKARYGKAGRAEAKANKQLGNDIKLSGKEKEIMRLQDKVSKKQNDPNFNVDTDPDLKRLQQLSGDISKDNPDALKGTMKNIRDYRKQNAPAIHKVGDHYEVNTRKIYRNGDNLVINPYEKGTQITGFSGKAERASAQNATTDPNKLKQQAQKQYNQASNAAYGKPATAK